MNKDQILTGLYNYLVENLPSEAINLIILNDIRVENFFAIHAGVYLDNLLTLGHINDYSFQHTILLHNAKRVHIDIKFTDINNNVTYLELKHFSITQNRGQGRRLSFYTSNSTQGKKVGIVSDCEKFDNLRNNGYIQNSANLVCCAFLTNKPTLEQINVMSNSFQNYQELNSWEVVYPVPFYEQNNNFGIITLQKNGRRI